MADILLRGLTKWTVDRLKSRAKRHGRSLQSELRDIIEREARLLTIDEALDRARDVRASLPASADDSLEMLREDRSR
ncbi:MAG: hypothetical protein EA380_07300 [Phycisphaeraceae bacterium]|nr:MAG: hypothetical protein EA380_07300 [Phycisphaeraceae bacterium]